MIQLLILLIIVGALADVGRYVIGLIRSQKPKLPWGAFILLTLCFLPALFGAYVEATAPAPRPPTRPPATRTPRPAATPTESAREACLRWDEVTLEVNGQDVCVFGVVQSVHSVQGGWTRITFTDKPNQFFMHSFGYAFEGLAAGSCVAAYGKVEFGKSTPSMDVGGNLYHCEEWMK